ncbi:hypothetical protein Dimus_032114 [Dionaea muscipula]
MADYQQARKSLSPILLWNHRRSPSIADGQQAITDGQSTSEIPLSPISELNTLYFRKCQLWLQWRRVVRCPCKSEIGGLYIVKSWGHPSAHREMMRRSFEEQRINQVYFEAYIYVQGFYFSK